MNVSGALEKAIGEQHIPGLAITSRTKAYQGARGEMTLHARNPEGTEYDFVYAIIPYSEVP